MYKYERKNKIISPYTVNYRALYGMKSGADDLSNSKSKIFKAINGKHHAKRTRKNLIKVNHVFRFLWVCVFLAMSSVFLVFAINFFEKFENSKKLKSYDNFILPVVMQNPGFFDEVNPPDEQMVLNAAIWDCAMNNKEAVYSEKDGRLILSEYDINNSVEKLFGHYINTDNAKYKKSGLYTFEKDENCYLIEAVSGTDNFAPRTLGCYNEGKDIVLNVGYICPKDNFDKNMNFLSEGKIEKQATFRLKKGVNNNYYIAAVSN